MTDWELRVGEVDDPVPGAGQVLTKVLACGSCAGAWDLAPMITGTVDIDGVPKAFADLGSPDEHAKIMVQPA